MPNRFTEFLDMDAGVIILIALGNFLNIDSGKLISVVTSQIGFISILDDILKLLISVFSVLILYKKYKKIK